MYNDQETDLIDPSLVDAVKRILQGKAVEGDVDKVQDTKQEPSVSEKASPKKENEIDTEYEKFFMKALKKFGVNEPDELPDDKKKEFFNYVDKNWKAKGEKAETKIRSTRKGSVDGRTKAYKETVKRLLAKK